MKVSATGMPVARLNCRRVSEAPTRTTPLPASITGLTASWMSWTARMSSAEETSGRRRSARTSSGSSRWVAPGFCAWATLNALRTTSGMIFGLVTRAFHFTIGRMMPSRSMY